MIGVNSALGLLKSGKIVYNRQGIDKERGMAC